MEPIQENVKKIFALEKDIQNQATLFDKFSDQVVHSFGSLTSILIHTFCFTTWIILNLFPSTWDPYPFNFLTLTVSLEAIYLSIFLLISQNRQGFLSERRAHLDLQINLLSEQESTELIRTVNSIARKLGIAADPTKLGDNTDLGRVSTEIEENLPK